MHTPCSVINTIANDPGFRVATALLYMRSGKDFRRRLSSKVSLQELNSTTPKILVTDVSRRSSKVADSWDLTEDEPDLGLLNLHRDRLAAAAEALGWYGIECLQHTTASLEILRSKLQSHIQQLTPVPANILESRKVMIRVGKDGTVDIESSVIGQEASNKDQSPLPQGWVPKSLDDLPVRDFPPSKVYLDTQPTRSSTFTTHKTNHRCVFTTARERLDILPSIAPNVQEVILYNPYGEVTESSTATLYFKRNGQWITPSAICGPMLGVTRRLAIAKGLCKQAIIEIKELQSGEEIWLSNAVRGFFRGVVTTDAATLKATADSEELNLARIGAGTSSDAGYGRALKAGSMNGTQGITA